MFEILTIGNGLIAQREQVFCRIAGYVAQLAVDLQAPSIQVEHRDAYRRILKSVAVQGLAAASTLQRFFKSLDQHQG